MKAIIMAGGFGTRLRPLTINLPKPMVPVADCPIMEHVVGLLAKHGITDITAVTYFQAETIKNYFKDGSAFGVTMDYAQPDEDFGTAGAVRFAAAGTDEPILVISGDLITDFDLTQAIKWHQERQAEATILLTRVENPLAYGIVIANEDGRIGRFMEKPSWGEAFSDTINTGIYILQGSTINLIPPRTNFDFSQNLFPLMLSRQAALYGKIMDGYWRDVGNVDEYRRTHVDFFEGSLNLPLRLETIDGRGGTVYRGSGVQIGEEVELIGRVVLGDNAQIESGVRLHNCVIGDRVRVGGKCNLENSVVWSDSTIGAGTVMRSKLIGRTVQFVRNRFISHASEALRYY